MSEGKQYIAVEWIHQLHDEPILLYAEVDERGWETRKVEVFKGGTTGYADKDTHQGNTFLAIEPLPLIEEIANDP